MLTKTDIKALKKRLPRPFISVLAERSGMSRRSVSYFMEGKKYYLEVHQAAVELAEEFDKMKKDLLDRQKNLSNAK